MKKITLDISFNETQQEEADNLVNYLQTLLNIKKMPYKIWRYNDEET